MLAHRASAPRTCRITAKCGRPGQPVDPVQIRVSFAIHCGKVLVVKHLTTIDTYFDEVPRAASRLVEAGPFAVFVSEGPFPYYARPLQGRAAGHVYSPDEVSAAVDLQRGLGIPVAFEWVDDLDPSVAEACTRAGLVVVHHPLLAVPTSDFAHVPTEAAPPSVHIQLVGPPDDLLIREQRSVGHIGFGHGGTAVTNVGVSERAAFPPDPPFRIVDGASDRNRSVGGGRCDQRNRRRRGCGVDATGGEPRRVGCRADRNRGVSVASTTGVSHRRSRRH